MREVNTKQHTHTHTKKPRKSNKLELLVIHVMMTGSLVLVLYPVLYDLNKFSYTLYGYFYTRPVCFYQILQAMPVKPRPLRGSVRNIRTPQRFLAMTILSFRLLWHDVKPKRLYCKLMLKSVRLRPCLPRSRFFDVTQRSFGGSVAWHPKNRLRGRLSLSAIVKNVWSLGRCFDKHKRAFSLVEQCRVTSWPCP